MRLAFAPRMLILAALGLAATSAGWRVIGDIFSGSDQPVLQELIAANSIWPSSSCPTPAGGQRQRAGSRHQCRQRTLEHSQRPVPQSVRSGQVERTVALFTYLLLCGLWAVIVWSLFGGAITRIAALWFAREDRLSFRRARWAGAFASGRPISAGRCFRWLACCWPSSRWPIGPAIEARMGVLVVGIIWPIVLLCGLFLAILLVGLLFGWPLMWPTISAEGTDSFDALSRSYSYTYQRPVHYLFYAAVAGILGMLAWIVVIIFANGVITYSYWAASWGSGGGPKIAAMPKANRRSAKPRHASAASGVQADRLLGRRASKPSASASCSATSGLPPRTSISCCGNRSTPPKWTKSAVEEEPEATACRRSRPGPTAWPNRPTIRTPRIRRRSVRLSPHVLAQVIQRLA